MVRHYLGVNFEHGALAIRPALYPGSPRVQADLRYRQGRLKLEVSGSGPARSARVNGKKVKLGKDGVLRLPADRIDDPEVAIGKRTRRAVDTGTVLRPDLLEFPPLIKRGDRVRIVAESAGLRISAFGQAKQKGAQGELIPVVNLDSNKVIHARVVDSQTVRIEF